MLFHGRSYPDTPPFLFYFTNEKQGRFPALSACTFGVMSYFGHRRGQVDGNVRGSIGLDSSLVIICRGELLAQETSFGPEPFPAFILVPFRLRVDKYHGKKKSGSIP